MSDAATVDDDLVRRLRERAQDPARRSDAAARAASATPAADVLGSAPAGLADRSPEFQQQVQDYLGGVNSPLAGLLGGSATGADPLQGLLSALSAIAGGDATVAMGGVGPVSLGERRAASPAPPPATEEAVTAAERELGFELPGALRRLYLEVADGGVGPGAGLYSLAELVAKRAEMTGEPVGPQGQAWPAHLLPVSGQDWDLVSVDRESGRLVCWDLEELDDDEDLPPDQPTWATSFVPEADDLAAWLRAWLDG